MKYLIMIKNINEQLKIKYTIPQANKISLYNNEIKNSISAVNNYYKDY